MSNPFTPNYILAVSLWLITGTSPMPTPSASSLMKRVHYSKAPQIQKSFSTSLPARKAVSLLTVLFRPFDKLKAAMPLSA